MCPKAASAGVLRRTILTLMVFSALLLAAVRAPAASDPTQGPGGPILVLTSSSATFGKYYAEILRTEGLNDFAVADVSTLTTSLLSSYDVVVLAKVPLTSSQVSTLSTWVQSGGNLIAMDPDPQLAGLLGITPQGSSIANGYLLASGSSPITSAIAQQTLQFHGTASLYALSGASSLATLYSTATQPTANPAITLVSVGTAGGQAAAFAYDLATSIVYTRQGNPLWVGQERDGISPIRSDDLFYGPAAADPQPNWVDLGKISIPQADEQQRLFANLITLMALDRKPLPRFWYLPNGNRSVVVMTGDDHANNGTGPQFDRFIAASSPGCSVDGWTCIRGTSYMYPDTPLSNAQAVAYQSQGFEIGVHVSTGCNDYTQSSLEDIFTSTIALFSANFPGVQPLSTERIHCIAWGDWVWAPKVELSHGIRLDTNYYYWPPGWVNDVPGQFTGSAMPMRFADLDGTILDIFQVVTQMTDESGQTFPFTSDTLLSRAAGSEEQYGVYTVNAHTDSGNSPVAQAVINSAQSWGVPVISARQLLKWLDARNASSFGNLSWNGNVLTFTVTADAGANGLLGMLPYVATNGVLSTITRGGSDVPLELLSIKGVVYAQFPAQSGSYIATYTSSGTNPPTITQRTPAPGATGVAVNTTVTVKFNTPMTPSSISALSLELRDGSGALVPASVSYSAPAVTATLSPSATLAPGTTYTVTVKGGTSGNRVLDAAGNAMASDVSWSFTTQAAPSCPCSGWDPATVVPAIPDSGDTGSVELGVKFRSDVAGQVTGVRFYKSAANTGTHIGNLWSSSGQLLGSVTFSNETASGWQQANFSAPITIAANTVYVISYHAPNGHYAFANGYFAATGVDSPPLHILRDGESGGNGVFVYASAFPSSSNQASNYFVDVVFSAASVGPDNVAPTVAITGPTGGSSFATTVGSIAMAGTASDNVGVTQVSWSDDRGGSGTATGTASWSIAAVALQSGVNVVTVTARDAAGNTATAVLTVTYTPTVDTTPPTVTTSTPVAGATGVAVNAPMTVTFSEALDVATVSSSTFELRNASNQVVATSATYQAATNGVSVTPSASLAPGVGYTLTVRGGAADPRVKDVAGNALAANYVVGFTTASNGCPCSIWSALAVPAVLSASDTGAVELGLKFRADASGVINGVRFYKGTANTGTHIGHLWTASGQLLASVTFTGETASGWQQATFATPVAIAANTVYVVSYFAPNGRYSDNSNYFASAGTDNGSLHALKDGVSGGNGAYAYGSGGLFPSNSFQSTNYWVDVLYTPDTGGPDTTPPTVVGRSPASGATGVPTGTPVTITFSEAIDPATVTTSTVLLYDPSNAPVPAVVNWSASNNTATLVPSAALQPNTTYTAIVKGGVNDPRIKDLAGNPLFGDALWVFTTGTANPVCALNAITAENCVTGNPASEWDVSGTGDSTIQGFATQISVNRGGTVTFKVATDAAAYRFDIYRMGYYGGMGARKIATFNPSASLPQGQPNCLVQAASGLIDCGNWAVSGSWTVPANATSGIYFAKITRADTGGASHIVFIVRNDASTSDIVFQTSDTTWQAYNNYGGNSLYTGGPGTNPGRAYKVSYNRPFATRGVDGGQDWVFNSEYPMVRWLEANGYDISYITGVDSDRTGSLLLGHRTFLSVGHDEYWSGGQRANVEAARNAGVNLAFFSGNEIFWKTRWENSIDGTGTTYRTLVSYKETHANAKIDPTAEWTGTWRDPRFSPPADGGRPENALSGTIFMVNSGVSAIVVPAAEGKMRLWRNTSVASLSTGQVATMPNGTLGYEWDSDLDNGSRPAGLIRLSDATVPGVSMLLDQGSTYGTGTVNHAMTMYRHSSGARVFGAGTIQWAWGLDDVHDRPGTPSDVRMKQATVNLLADMNAQPATLQSGLVLATATSDSTAPTVTIASPAAGATLSQGVAVTISGTAADIGGAVGGVEVSVDDGVTWNRASGRETWSFNWTPATSGAVILHVRAADDSGNYIPAGTSLNVTVSGGGSGGNCPCSIWASSANPQTGPTADSGSVELGTRFRAATAGNVTAIRFYKSAADGPVHIGSLWSSTGQLLGQVTFSGESTSGWQQANLPTPVAIAANTWYVVSYHTSGGSYYGDHGYFATQGQTNGPLYAARDGEAGGNGIYVYSSAAAFPTQTSNSSSYWADIVFNTGTAPGDTTAPVVTIGTPTSSDTFSTAAATLALGGTASDDVGVTQVTWTNSAGGSGTATGTTTWNVSSVALTVGTNAITVTASDAAGNTSTDTLTVTRTSADTTPPVVTITAPTSATTLSTAASTVALGGTASDAVGVTQVTWTNSAGGSGTATGTTSWTIGTVALTLGSNVITVTASDAAGNTSTDTLTVTRTSADTTPPVVTITAPTSATTLSTAASTVALGGTASDAVGVTQVTWTNSAGGSGTATGTTSWTIGTVALTLGSNVITVTASDAAGNTSSDVLTITRTATDTNAPVVTITAPTSATTLSTALASVTLGGTASDDVGVTQVTWTNSAGGSGTATGTTSWSAGSVALTVGSNVITVTARDAAGNTSSDVLTITRTADITAPVVTITAPTSATTLSTALASVTLSGTASDAVGVTQVTWANSAGGSGTATGTTSWNAGSVALTVGSNVITVTASDAAGNTSTDVLTITRALDTTAPIVTITTPTTAATYSTTATTLTVRGSASDNAAVTQVTWSNSAGGSGTATGTTSWSVTSAALVIGTNVFTVTARDAAGNTSTATLTVTRTDATRPTVTITSPTSSATLSTTLSAVTLGGTASDNVGVTQVTWTNSAGGSGTAIGTTSWSAGSVALVLGVNVLTVTASDAAGNVRTDTLTVTRTPDITAPLVTITSPTSATTFTTTAASLTVGGTASDAVGVTQVTWVSNQGGLSGTATGTTSWQAPVALSIGANLITVTARDAAGNTRTDAITITRN